MQGSPDQSTNPQITICVATFNSGVYLDRTLAAIELQSYPHFRCLLSDDGSTDNTLEICQSYARRDSRFILQAHKQRQGWIGNMNRMLEQDLGEYFLFVSHDDVPRPAFLEKLLHEMLLRPDASVVYSDVEIVRTDGTSRKIQSYALPEGTDSIAVRFKFAATEKEADSWYLPYHGLVRANILKFNRRLRRNLAGEYKADKVWNLGLAISGRMIRLGEPLWEKTDSPNSVSSRWTYTSRTLAAVQLCCLRFLWSHPAPFKDRLLVSYYLFFGYARSIAWKVRRYFVRSAPKNG